MLDYRTHIVKTHKLKSTLVSFYINVRKKLDVLHLNLSNVLTGQPPPTVQQHISYKLSKEG